MSSARASLFEVKAYQLSMSGLKTSHVFKMYEKDIISTRFYLVRSANCGQSDFRDAPKLSHAVEGHKSQFSLSKKGSHPKKPYVQHPKCVERDSTGYHKIYIHSKWIKLRVNVVLHNAPFLLEILIKREKLQNQISSKKHNFALCQIFFIINQFIYFFPPFLNLNPFLTK